MERRAFLKKLHAGSNKEFAAFDISRVLVTLENTIKTLHFYGKIIIKKRLLRTSVLNFYIGRVYHDDQDNVRFINICPSA